MWILGCVIKAGLSFLLVVRSGFASCLADRPGGGRAVAVRSSSGGR